MEAVHQLAFWASSNESRSPILDVKDVPPPNCRRNVGDYTGMWHIYRKLAMLFRNDGQPYGQKVGFQFELPPVSLKICIIIHIG